MKINNPVLSFKSYVIQIIYKVNIIIQRKIYNYEKTFELKLDTVLQGLSFQMFEKIAETEKN